MKKLVGMTALWLALCVVTYLINHNFILVLNAQNLSRQIAMLAIFAIGEGIVILSGGIDLSVGSVIAFAGLFVMVGTNNWGVSPWIMSIFALVLCAILGLWHGFLVSKLKLQPFIVTLATMLFLRGFSRGFVNDQQQGLGNSHPGFVLLGVGDWLGVPIPVWILIIVALIAAYILHTTKAGRYLYAIGRNEKAAAYSGVNVSGVKILSYVISSVLAGVAAILYATYSNSVQPAASGNAYELYAIAAAVLGGCSMRAGEGTVIGIILGAAILKTLTNATIMLHIAAQWELSVIGVVILAGVLADIIYKQRLQRRRA